jgi:hypothetical protein
MSNGGKKEKGNGVEATEDDDHDIDELVKLIKTRVESMRAEKGSASPKAEIGHVKAEWGSRKKPVSVDNLSKWVSNDDFDWAKSIGIYVYPKGFTREEGITIRAPKLSRALDASLPVDRDLTAQDVAMGILNAIVSVRPELGPKDLVRVFAIISSEIGLQYFPHLLRPPLASGLGKRFVSP